MEERELPRPDSPQLKELFPSDLHRAIYRVLYERRTDPPTMQEVQDAVGRDLGEQAAQQVHFSKRLRELRDHFEIPHPSAADGYRYRLSGWRAVPRGESGISTKLAARVRRHARCAMCGKTPNEDGVRLHIDHKVPREWGGKSEEENLQALCSDCNEGKKHTLPPTTNTRTRSERQPTTTSLTDASASYSRRSGATKFRTT